MTQVRWEINPEKTALLVIDMQNDFMLPDSPLAAHGALELAATLNHVIAEARARGVRVVFTATTHSPGADRGRLNDFFPAHTRTRRLEDGTPGWQLHPSVDFREGDTLIKKPRYSAFWKTDLDDILRRSGIDTLILGGVWSNCCVESTARDAFFRDYKVVCLSDGTAAGDLPDVGYGSFKADEIHRLTLTDLAMYVCEVATSADVLSRLARGGR